MQLGFGTATTTSTCHGLAIGKVQLLVQAQLTKLLTRQFQGISAADRWMSVLQTALFTAPYTAPAYHHDLSGLADNHTHETH